jgi:hypothetical protein
MKNINKVLSLLTIVAFGQFAFADEVMTLPKGAVALHQLKNVQVLKVEDGCPEGARCLVASTKITARFTMACTSAMSPVGYVLQSYDDGTDDKLYIGYTAFEITNEFATRVRCVAPHYETIQIVVSRFVPDVAHVTMYPTNSAQKL